MERNGLRIGSFAGAPVTVDWTVAIVAGYWVISDFTEHGLAGLPGALLFVGAILLAILVHEFGHAAMARAFDVRAAEIVLTFFGGQTQFLTAPQKRWQDILVSIAGPGANLALWAALVFAAAPHTPAASEPARQLYYFLSQLALVNLLLGAFNLLPGYPLDGGAMARALLSYFVSSARARWIVGWSGVVIATAIGVWGLMSGLFWTAGIGLMLALSAFAEVTVTGRVLPTR